MRYPGGKGASGVAQRIISLMPMHDRYIEPFLGGGMILRTKRPAARSIACDLDENLIVQHRAKALPGVEYRTQNAIELLTSLEVTERDLVYLDPPYMPETRTKKRIYHYELDVPGHMHLLALASELKAKVMISGYRCAFYDEALAGWHREDFQAMTRGGVRTESVWCNFTPGESYHDTRFLGGNFRERERIKRKRQRWSTRFAAMSAIEKAVIWEALETTRSARDHIASSAVAAGDIGRDGERIHA